MKLIKLTGNFIEMKIDIHTHTLGIDNTPELIFGKISKFVGKSKTRLNIISKILHYALPTNRDILERLSIFLNEMGKSTEQKIQELLQDNDMVIINTIDLEYAGAGNVNIKYEKQIAELIILKKKYNIKIFVHLDNKRQDLYKLASFFAPFVDGWKLYPPVSGYPNDECIKAVLRDFPKHVTTHCTDSSPIYYHGNVDELLIEHWTTRKGTQKNKCQSFSHPYWVFLLANEFKNINFNFAHAGGNNKEWQSYIIHICKDNDNCFTDTSYTFKDVKGFSKVFDAIPDKLLFGTDDCMCDGYSLPNMAAMQKNHKKFLNID